MIILATREEMLAWAKSLKPGDKVIYRECWDSGNLSVLEVAKVTPAGWVKTTDGLTFAQNSWSSGIEKRSRYDGGEIVPVTDELLQKFQQQEAERAEKERKRSTIVKAKDILRAELEASRDMTYERAVKIIESLGGKYAENSENN